MTLDDIVLKALEDGRPVTVNDVLDHLKAHIVRRLEAPIRDKLNRLRVRGVVVREGRGGPNRKFTYRLVKPELAAEAIGCDRSKIIVQLGLRVRDL